MCDSMTNKPEGGGGTEVRLFYLSKLDSLDSYAS